jgi:hypothetical protein
MSLVDRNVPLTSRWPAFRDELGNDRNRLDHTALFLGSLNERTPYVVDRQSVLVTLRRRGYVLEYRSKGTAAQTP